jgi:GntR family transcriptional regulator
VATGKIKYFEIKERIEAMIRQGEIAIGGQLPSEPELAQMFNVSRGTIRQALSELSRDAIIARRSGAGTFVIRSPDKSTRIVSLTQQIRDAGMEPSTTVLAKERITARKAGEWVWAAFLVPEDRADDTFVYRIDRLRCGDGQPLARQTLYLLASDYRADLLNTADLTQSIFKEVYEAHYRRVGWASERIQARPATDKEVKLLHMQDLPLREQFVYQRNRISYDQENMPLEVLVSIDRGNSFKAYRYRIVEEDRVRTGNGDQ